MDTPPSSEHDKTQSLIHAGILCGIAAGAAYPLASVSGVPSRVSNIAIMLFGSLLAVSMYGMRSFHARARDTACNDIAHLLLVLAALYFTLMATMQMSIHQSIPKLQRLSLEPGAATRSAILRGVSSTRLGIDYSSSMLR